MFLFNVYYGHRSGSRIFREGGLKIEVISEAGGLGDNTKIMPNPRFRAYLSKYKEVLSQIWNRGRGGCNPLEDIGCFIS